MLIPKGNTFLPFWEVMLFSLLFEACTLQPAIPSVADKERALQIITFKKGLCLAPGSVVSWQSPAVDSFRTGLGFRAWVILFSRWPPTNGVLAHTNRQDSQLYAHLFPVVSSHVLVAWNQLWCKYLYHRIWQTLQNRFFPMRENHKLLPEQHYLVACKQVDPRSGT